MIDFLVDNRWLVLLVAVVVWGWFAWALMRSRAPVGAGAMPGGRSGRIARPVSNRIPARKPGDVVPLNRTSTAGLAPSIEAGLAEHHLRSAAATTKLSSQPVDEKRRPTEAVLKAARGKTPPPATEKDDDTPKQGASVDAEEEAKDSLFAGLGEAEDRSSESPGTHAIKNAARMEEKGFHYQIESEKLPSKPSEPPAAKAPAAVSAPAPITPPPAEPSIGAPAKPRSQTAELDDILKRIDQVLAESPSAPPPASAPKPPPAASPQSGEKIDPNDVLRRIDEALAESQGDRASQMTVPRPDWAKDAKRSAEETRPRPDWGTEPAQPTETAPRPPLEPPRQTPSATKAAEITVPRPDWADEAKQRAEEDTASGASPIIVPAATPAAPVAPPAKKPSTAEAVPDWARGDIQDEDLDKDAKAKPEQPKGGEEGPQQQKLF